MDSCAADPECGILIRSVCSTSAIVPGCCAQRTHTLEWSPQEEKSGGKDLSVPCALVEFCHSGELTPLHLWTVSCSAMADPEGAQSPERAHRP